MRVGAIVWQLWRFHGEVCSCRAGDGARCELARDIRRVTRSLRWANWSNPRRVWP